MSRLLHLVACAALAGMLLLPFAQSATAAPCWKQLMTDWYDGRIDRVYAVSCYQQAIDRLPADLRLYSSARDDILDALQAATVPEPTPAPPETTAALPETTPPPASTPTTTAPSSDPAPPAPIPRSAPESFADESDSLPLPLLALGGLAVVLVSVGGGGMLWRRFRGGPEGS